MTEEEAQAAYDADRERTHLRVVEYVAKHSFSEYEATKRSLVDLVKRIGELICARASAEGSICWCTSLEERKKQRKGFIFECNGPHSERHQLHVELKRHLARYRDLRRQYETQRDLLRNLGMQDV